MRPAAKIAAVLAFIISITPACGYPDQDNRNAPPAFPFQGTINSNGINIRSDSTVSSEMICKINKGNTVEVVRESYGWYKIRLPKTAPSFIKKDLVSTIGNNAAKVLKDNVNIRMQPNESSRILGRADKYEVVSILRERGAWYKIEPVNNSFGWIHKNFVDVAAKPDQEIKKEDTSINKGPLLIEPDLIFEGVVKPYGKVFRRNATHKLITPDKKVFLLKGNKESLDNLNYRKVRVSGKLINLQDYNPVIQITKIEALD